MLTNLALYPASSSALCRGSAAPAADARDKPKHDERKVGRLCQQSEPVTMPYHIVFAARPGHSRS
ncbi:hypothetical protein GFM13_19455 [Rhizobium leguminosarum bv. viciae]|nr:hypothetical protein [Rhizobium leguminosarum bv. viciae]